MKVHFIQHVPFEHPGYLIDWATQQNYPFSITHIYETVALPAIEDLDVLIIMGGPMGTYEEAIYPWLKTEKQFIKSAIDAGKKVFGICLGCQLIADVLGSKVYPHTNKEIGWWPVYKVDEVKQHLLLKQLPPTFTTFHWHGDTFDLPAGAIHLLRSEACGQQGFLYKNNVAAIQFHMEVKDDLLHNMTEHDKSELVVSTYVQSEETINKLLPVYIDEQHQYISNFVDAFLAL